MITYHEIKDYAEDVDQSFRQDDVQPTYTKKILQYLEGNTFDFSWPPSIDYDEYSQSNTSYGTLDQVSTKS